MQKKVEHFGTLLQDVKKFEAEDTEAGIEPNYPAGETSLARVTWAARMIKAQHDSIDRLLIDLKQSMNAVSESALYSGLWLTYLPSSSFSNFDPSNRTNWRSFLILRTKPFSCLLA